MDEFAPLNFGNPRCPGNRFLPRDHLSEPPHPRGALKKGLLQHPSRTRVMCPSRHHAQITDSHGRIINTISISERPPSTEDRAVPGHWEGDLIFGTNNSQIVTLVERQTRYVMMAKVDSKDTKTVINALVKHAHCQCRQSRLGSCRQSAVFGTKCVTGALLSAARGFESSF